MKKKMNLRDVLTGIWIAAFFVIAAIVIFL